MPDSSIEFRRELSSRVARDRQVSPASSVSSDLSILSRSPSPPPTLLPTSELPTSRPNNPFVHRIDKRASYHTPAPSAKRPRLETRAQDSDDIDRPKDSHAILRKSLVPRKPHTPSDSRTAHVSFQKRITHPHPTAGNCILDRLPKEIRQRIYAYCLNVHDSICVKQCCGPNSTHRERASCKKHGNHCSKIGKGNGLTLYDEDLTGLNETYGRFVVLSLSRAIYLEAFWVLYAQGSVLIRATEALQPYLGKSQCNFYRLPNHATEHAKWMWLSVARFRNVRLELPWHKFSLDHPVDCIYRLYEAAAFLMKAWSMQASTSKTPSPTVIVDLASLYTSILPFNYTTSTELAHEWTAYWQPEMESRYISDFDHIGQRTAEIAERLVDLTGRHGGESRWKIVAEAPMIHEDSEEEGEEPCILLGKDHAVTAEMHSLENICALNGVEFETRASAL